MKLLTFQVRSFTWEPHQRTLEDAPDANRGSVSEAVVVFIQAEMKDGDPERKAGVFKKTLKHVKWLANKRSFKNIVLHSFTHLGGDNASPEFARQFIAALAERLIRTGYTVHTTPFGWFCSWTIDVYGDSLAKVWKDV